MKHSVLPLAVEVATTTFWPASAALIASAWCVYNRSAPDAANARSTGGLRGAFKCP